MRCLQPIVDEIIIVDTGSSDATKEIAGKYTDKIYDFEWVNDFAEARNFSFSKASMTIFMLQMPMTGSNPFLVGIMACHWHTFDTLPRQLTMMKQDYASSNL